MECHINYKTFLHLYAFVAPTPQLQVVAGSMAVQVDGNGYIELAAFAGQPRVVKTGTTFVNLFVLHPPLEPNEPHLAI